MAKKEYLDESGVSLLWSKIKSLLSKKVDSVDGKQLSTEDYTAEEKEKLAGIEDSANNYTLPIASSSTLGGVMVGGNISISEAGKISVPTATTSRSGVVRLTSDISDTTTYAVARMTILRNLDSRISSHRNDDDIHLSDADRQKLDTIASVSVDDEEPVDESIDLWVDTSEDEYIPIPEIKDDEISTVDTWSSKKISEFLGGQSAGSSIHVGEDEPEDTSVPLWIETDSDESYDIPEVRDDLVNTVDTWSSSKINQAISYTTEEILTGGTWIDGKPIYRQVLQINGSGAKAEQLSIPLGDFSLGFLIRMDGGFFTDGDFCVLSTAHDSSFNGNVYARIRYATTAPELRIVCGASRSIDSGYAIVEYTKITD